MTIHSLIEQFILGFGMIALGTLAIAAKKANEKKKVPVKVTIRK